MYKYLMIFLFSANLWAQGIPTLSAQEKEMLKNNVNSIGSISKKDIESSLDTLIKQGVINADQAAKAREQLKKMNQQDIDQLKEKSLELIK